MKAFLGNAAKKYFENMEDVLEKGEKCIQAGQEGDKPKGYEPARVKVQKMNQDLLAQVSKHAVVVDDSLYEYLQAEIKRDEDDLQDKIRYVVDSMLKLCGTKYNIPSSTPKIQKMLEDIKATLAESNQLTENTNQLISGFVGQIENDDR